MIRGDLSNQLIHLTKGPPEQASASFLNIIKLKKLIGGNGNIRGGYTCICFSEAPLNVLSLSLSEEKKGFRYAPLGLIVSKYWFFKQGGRPVIYQPEEDFLNLPECFKFRHVKYNPLEGIDYTWEREWRIHEDKLDLDPKQVTLVVPTRKWEDYFLDKYLGIMQATAMTLDDMAFAGLSKPEWHFIVLEDLGVTLPDWPTP